MAAPSHSYKGGGAASGVLSRDCDSYWNSAVSSSGPWNLTIDTGKPISPTGFEYSIFVPDEAPLAFAVEATASADGPWHQVICLIGAEGLDRRGPPGACRLFLGPGFRLGARWNRLVETVKTRKKRGKTGGKWARYGLKRVKDGS